MEKVTQTIKMKAGATLTITQPFKQLNIIKGANVLTDIDAADFDKIRCDLQVAGETGARKVTADSGKKNHYALSSGNVVFTIKTLPKGISTLVFRCYLANVYLDSRIDIVCDEAEAATTITMQTISLKAAEKDEAGTLAAVLYDRPQELNDDEKAQAKANIGLEGEVGATAVSYETQTLNDKQKTRARLNIGAAGAAEVAAALAKKANVDGFYSQLTAGAAENLVGGNETSRKFTRDTAGGTADIADGIVQIDRIKGNTIVWNQICNEMRTYMFQSGAVGKFTQTYSDGIITCTATENITNIQPTSGYVIFTTNLILGHKYITYFKVKPSTSVEYTAQLSNSENGRTVLQLAENAWNQIKIYSNVSAINSGNAIYGMPKAVSIGDTFAVKEYSIIDLTQMFGAGNEPATVAEFEKMFSLGYYDYNAGQLLSLNPTGIKTVGFNAYNHATGKASVIGGKQYQITGAYTSIAEGDTAITPDEDGLFTPTKNGDLTIAGGDITTTCVHLVWSGIRNGDYEEHWEGTRNLPIAQINTDGTITESATGKTRLFPDGLCSVGSVNDEVTSTKAIKRIAKQTITGAIGDEITLVGCNLSTTEYKSVSDYGTLANGVLTLTAAVTNKDVLYELATPVEVTFAEPLNLTYRVSDFGTETLLPQNGAAPTTAPVKMDVVYGLNVVDFVRNADKNFVTIEDGTGDNGSAFTNLRSALSTAFAIDIVPTYDATNKRYTFAITDNRKVEVPASATASGLKGTWAEDETSVYFCTDTDTWVKISKTTWE